MHRAPGQSSSRSGRPDRRAVGVRSRDDLPAPARHAALPRGPELLVVRSAAPAHDHGDADETRSRPDPARLRAAMARAVAAVPRLRQRVRGRALDLALPRWEDDPDLRPRLPRAPLRPGAGPARTNAPSCFARSAPPTRRRSTAPARCGSADRDRPRRRSRRPVLQAPPRRRGRGRRQRDLRRLTDGTARHRRAAAAARDGQNGAWPAPQGVGARLSGRCATGSSRRSSAPARRRALSPTPSSIRVSSAER